MSKTSTVSGKDEAPAVSPLTGGKMTLGAYAKVTSADATFIEEGEQLNINTNISVEQKGNEVIITAELKDLEGRALKGRRRISQAMLKMLAELLESGGSGWHVAEKKVGTKGQYFDFVKVGS